MLAFTRRTHGTHDADTTLQRRALGTLERRAGEVALLEAALEVARRHRDGAVLKASDLGCPRRRVGNVARLAVSRVQAIVNGRDKPQPVNPASGIGRILASAS